MSFVEWIKGFPEVGAFPLWIADKFLSLVRFAAVNRKEIFITKVPHEERYIPKPWIVIHNRGLVKFSVLKVGFFRNGRCVWMGEHFPWAESSEETPRDLDPGTSVKFTVPTTENEIWYECPPACMLSSGKIVTGSKAVTQDQPRSAR